MNIISKRNDGRLEMVQQKVFNIKGGSNREIQKQKEHETCR